MMTNSDIIDILELTAKLMDLHGEDEFRIRTYTNAAYNLNNFSGELSELDITQLTQIQGVGKSMASKIREVIDTGSMKDLNDLLEKTPEGVLAMFKIKGLGAKKIKTLWNELGIDNLNELRISCENGSVAKIKGFGEKIQASILESLAFLQSQEGKLRMDKAEILAADILEVLEKFFENIEITGQGRRKCEVVDKIEFIASKPIGELPIEDFIEDEQQSSPFVWRGKFRENKILLEIRYVSEKQRVSKQFIYSSNEEHLSHRNETGKTLFQIASDTELKSEEEIYEKFGVPYIIPEMREGTFEYDWIKNHSNDELVTWESLRGILHNHSTYSDGRHSLAQMADFCKSLGFEYLGIADHSQTATYAKGLQPYKIIEQHEEIDTLNKKYAADTTKPFKILKGIESDILGDGSLDYPEEILASFDYIVASVHSNLTMTEPKATERLIKAIENPHTTILGHPTGRLLLSRQGYPIDYKAVIDACAACGVVIEINASPYRLDLDWRWMQYALEKNVMLSINPDAHEMEGYYDMHFGVAVARKGGLTSSMTFNSLTLSEIENYLSNRKSKL